ncbi:Por secretion system C-terminal sorting domain-containing protein [Pontibacter indicus]|uniref:Por secretion system C-terminal sorting domain-containing protein n=1 Tax=Pontibacter indicus TaxID=1317125 RepID=A0A1R3WAE7_9BACT|nr:Por secretion system C-terminal sorting domain-containing protein [Pontibacter indicus]
MLQAYKFSGFKRSCASLCMRTSYSKFYRKSWFLHTLLYLILLLPFSTGLLAQPSGFTNVQIGSNWDAAVGLTFSKDGNRIYVWEKGGKVWIVENGQKLPTPLIDISEEVGNWVDHGLLGFALDPNFDSNGYLYLLYVVDRHHLLYYGTGSYSPSANDFNSATIGRLTRYTARSSDNRKTTDLSTRKILIGESISKGIPILYMGHGVGSLIFGEDGSLLVSTGDAGSAGYVDTGYDPANPNDTYVPQAIRDGIITERDNIGAYRAQQVNSLNGKILRIDPATGNGLSSNPFYNSADPRAPASRVWALGFRNPFRFTIKPGSGGAGNPGTLYIGDVGWYNYEEINVAPRPGMNFGWPIYEGLEQQEWHFHRLVYNTQTAQNPLYGQGGCTQQYFLYRELILQPRRTTQPYFGNPCNWNVTIPSSSFRLFVHARPAFDWLHVQKGGGSRTGTFNGEDATVVNIGAAGSPVTGPQFGGGSVTGGVWYTGNDFPAQYKNTYFFGDYVGGWIKTSTFDASDNPKSISNFVDNGAAVVAIATNPVSGGLYYINYAAQLRKISYGAGTNQPPKASASADKLYGPSPLTVRFSSTGSSDPEGQALKYEWNFGDGTAVSTEANPSHTFNATGLATYQVTLKVTDTGGLSTTANLTISVNNTPPTVQITSPAAGTKYPMTQNTVYKLAANVSDKEHAATQLKYEWQTVLHHNTHTHPGAIDTNPATSATITPVGCDGETYFYRINLKVTDPAGLSTATFVDLYPDCGTATTKPVAISSPANNSSFAAGSNVELKVTFTDLARTWTKVEYLAGTTVIGSSTTQPFNFTWRPTTAGSYSITARATDSGGHTSTSNPITVNITGTTTPGTGKITREYWANVHGTSVAAIPVSSTPTSVSELTSFEAPSHVGTNYGQRVRGYITAPASGQYTFWIAADDFAELWLSTTDNPAQKVRIASVPGWTNEREWTKSPSQQSVKITLEAGKRYYIEALHLEGGGGDHLAVGWQLPNSTLERPIPGNRLSPIGSTPPTASGKITRDYWASVYGTSVSAVPVNSTPTSTTELSIFEAPVNVGTNYGQRIRGYVTAPASGQYTFWIAGDDVAELYLSTSESPAQKVRIASVPGWTYEREWTKSPSQQSAKITLEAGKRYYIEAVHLEGGGSDHLAVGWQLPNGTLERPIPGSRLSPYTSAGIAATSMQAVNGSQLRQELSVYPNPFREELTLLLPSGMAEVQELRIFDMAGRQVYRSAAAVNVGDGKLELDLSPLKLNAGIYMLYCTDRQGASYKVKLSKR